MFTIRVNTPENREHFGIGHVIEYCEGDMENAKFIKHDHIRGVYIFTDTPFAS